MLSTKNLIHITSEDQFNKEVLKSTDPVIIDFGAEWCGPCRKLTPMLEKALIDNNTFKLALVNVDNNQELSEKFEVSGIPHVVLIHQGKKVMQFTGLDTSVLSEMIEKTKTLAKSKTFGGTGVVLDSNAKNLNENLPEEIFVEMLQSLPKEPEEFQQNVFNIIIKINNLSFSRRFSGSDKIGDIKLFAKCNIKTLNEIEMYESFPRKVYNDENALISNSGLSKNQILLVKLI